MNDFGTLIYTDCRPGQGLSGGAGLQFQAASSDVDGDAMAIVQRHLLYEPPSTWMRDQRPVGDYPPSFAHVGGDRYATAAGVYLGQEANGTREGNQLTHAVTTDDPKAYGILRPAQLFGAPFWTSKPAGGTRCEAVPAEPPPGVLDTEAVHEFVRRHPDGPRLLAALLSVLSRPDDGQAQQVLFVADQVEPVLTWVAAATLLMPHRQALEIGFKVFTTTPSRSSQRVLAVHPGWDEPPASADRPGGYLVVDLLAGRWSEAVTTPLAEAWAETFCAADDPFDVTDAVELAGASRLEPDEGAALARLAVLGEPPAPRHHGRIVGWLTDGPPDQVETYGPAVAATFAEHVADLRVELLRELDRATHAGRFPGQAVPVRMALLNAELRDAAALRPPRPDVVPNVARQEWTDQDTHHALRATLEALRATTGPAFAATLTVAGDYGVPVRLGLIGPRAFDFVSHWARNPLAAYSISSWPAKLEFVDALRDSLDELVDTDPRGVGEAWCRRLTPMDATARLDGVLIAARMATADGPERLTVLSERIRAAAAHPEPVEQFTALAANLWRFTQPARPELEELRKAMPPGAALHAGAVEKFLMFRAQSGSLDRADLDLAQRLADDRLLNPAQYTRDLIRDDAAMRDVCRRLADPKTKDTAVLTDIQRVSAPVRGMYQAKLVEALLSAGSAATVVAVLNTTPPIAQRRWADLAVEILKDKPAPSFVATAMAVVVGVKDVQAQDTVWAAVNKWARWAPTSQVDGVSMALDDQDLTTALDQWHKLLDHNKIRRGRAWLRRSKGK